MFADKNGFNYLDWFFYIIGDLLHARHYKAWSYKKKKHKKIKAYINSV